MSRVDLAELDFFSPEVQELSLIHISEPTRLV